MEREWKAGAAPRITASTFDRLIALNNMPISRFLEWLDRERATSTPTWRGSSTAFNPAAVAGLMCRNTLSVGWDGALYDCDFNQMLEMAVGCPARARPHPRLRSPRPSQARQIVTAPPLFRLHRRRGQLLRWRHRVISGPEAPAATTQRTGSKTKLVLWVVVVVALVALARHFNAQALLRQALDHITGLGAWGPVAFVLLYVVVTVLLLARRRPHARRRRGLRRGLGLRHRLDRRHSRCHRRLPGGPVPGARVGGAADRRAARAWAPSTRR